MLTEIQSFMPVLQIPFSYWIWSNIVITAFSDPLIFFSFSFFAESSTPVCDVCHFYISPLPSIPNATLLSPCWNASTGPGSSAPLPSVAHVAIRNKTVSDKASQVHWIKQHMRSCVEFCCTISDCLSFSVQVACFECRYVIVQPTVPNATLSWALLLVLIWDARIDISARILAVFTVVFGDCCRSLKMNSGHGSVPSTFFQFMIHLIISSFDALCNYCKRC